MHIVHTHTHYTHTNTHTRRNEQGSRSFERNPLYLGFDSLVEGGTVLAFKLPEITQAERQGERTEPKSLRLFRVSDKGQKAPFGRRCDAFHTAAAPLPGKPSPGGTKDFPDWGGGRASWSSTSP